MEACKFNFEPGEGCAKEQQPHVVHSIKWRVDGQNYFITCSKSQTVLSLLQTNLLFASMAKNNQTKEIVIMRDRAAISTHFPCHLIAEEDILTVLYIKDQDTTQDQDPGGKAKHKWRKTLPGETVTFNVETKGGKYIVRAVMKNISLKNKADKVCVYGYKGYTVKKVLKIDGRFKSDIFKRDCILVDLDKNDKDIIEMSTVVDDLDGRTFTIMLRGKFAVTNSQSSQEEEAALCEPPGSSSDSKDSPRGFTSSEMLNEDKPGDEPKMCAGASEPRPSYRKVPNSESVLNLLRAQYKDLVKHMRSREKTAPIQILRKDYGKSVETCFYVKTVKKLSERSNSVCQLRVNYDPIGSGFLLFDRFVLTNAHVIAEYHNQRGGELLKEVMLTFSYETLDEECEVVSVKEVVAFQKHEEDSGKLCDWALLELDCDQPGRLGLLEYFDYAPTSGGICIIGHPGEGVKKMDPCYVLPYNLQVEATKNKFQEYSSIITERFFNNDKRPGKLEELLIYDTCFIEGSSGSPVFDKDGNVIAMHSGGYVTKDRTIRIIEFAHHLSLIIDQIVLQLMKRCSYVVLRKLLLFIPQDSPKWTTMVNNVRAMIQNSTDLTALKRYAGSLEVNSDPILRSFFQLITQTEEVEHMNTN